MHPGVPVPMVRHDKERWRCPRCGHVHSTRTPSGAEALLRQVALGEALDVISAPKRQRLLVWLREQAKREFYVRPPGQGRKWWMVPLPEVAGLGWVALGVGRSPARGLKNNWRVLAFTQSMAPAGAADLVKQIGSSSYQNPAPLDFDGQVCGEEWLARVLVMSADQEEALARLWIIVGRTNAFSFRA